MREDWARRGAIRNNIGSCMAMDGNAAGNGSASWGTPSHALLRAPGS